MGNQNGKPVSCIGVITLISFLHTLFSSCGCLILHEADSTITIQLTEEADRDLMNRPFYWHYKDQLGQRGEPLAVTFFTEDPGRPLKQLEEYITFGSPRFHQLLSYGQKKVPFIKLYERHPSAQNVQLEPWLFIHFHLSYEADGKKEKLVPLALHLISGRYSEDFLETTASLSMEPSIAPYHYILSPLITPASGLNRMKQKVQAELLKENHDWANAAYEKQQFELRMLESFYDPAASTEHYEREKAAIIRRFNPVVRLSIWHGGLFYLARKT